MVNGKPSWTSTFQAIWYDELWNSWNVGSLNDIGSSTAEIYSYGVNQCPFDQPSEMWNYLVDNSWTTAGTNEINVSCLNGNF